MVLPYYRGRRDHLVTLGLCQDMPMISPRVYKACSYLIWSYSQARSRSTDVLFTLLRRGLVKEIFPKDVVIKCSGLPCAYAGFDATSDSLHVGNLLVLIALIHWQRSGNQSIVVYTDASMKQEGLQQFFSKRTAHKLLILMDKIKNILQIGDATAKVGDPSGHSTDRDILAADAIKLNADSVEKSIYRIFENHENAVWNRFSKKHQLLPIKVFRNSSWYNKMNAVDLITNAGRHLRIGGMLSRTSVKSRMDSNEGINFSEFSYQLFQSYDWLHLLENYKCQFQIGGNDQLGNIVTGYEMITGKYCKSVYGALLPLIQSESGDKYGKSSGNAVYLNSNRTNPFDLYQFFMRLPDADVKMFLNLFTFLSPTEVEDVVQKHMKTPDGRFAQKKIAEEVLLLVHGVEGLESAKRSTKAFYQSDIDSLTKMSLEEIKQVLPPSSMINLPFQHGLSLLELTLKAKCFLKENDAKRIIGDGGVYVNLERLASPEAVITPGIHILSNGTTLLRIGFH